MNLRKYLAEFIGTFALVFAGTGAIISNDVSNGAVTHPGIALTFGLVVMAIIYAVGDISGAHLNPAVTCGFWIAGRFPKNQIIPYVSVQLIGALVASGLLRSLFPDHETLGGTLPSGSWWQSFVFEIVLTFLLMYIVLCVAIGAKEKGIMAGAAIGATVALEAMFAGPISGASMNPARSLGPALVSGTWEHQWLYVVAPLLGAAFAVVAWRLTRDETNLSDE
ncbi:MAG: MIP family channel protein [Planctomycetaceae bacterium]|nr:MIP family channel protein [Planctomycetaceae bacterium]